MILQPLVENSIKHGLSRKVGAGSILIRSWREHGRAVIEVEDDGMGFVLDRLEQPMSSGIGLANVRERLRVIYGATLPADADQRAGQGHHRAHRDSRADGRGADHGMKSSSRRPPLDCRDEPVEVMVVDDEQLAREELCYQLEQIGDVEVVAQAGNGLEALTAVDRHEPDLVFLDIQMPGLSGFEVARRLLEREDDSPALVFVTAFDQHAIEAFEVNAVDYLLKPVEGARLEQALVRARRRLSSERPAAGPGAPLNDQLEQIVKMMAGRQVRRDQVAVKTGERFILVQADEIIYASAGRRVD